MSDGVGAVNVAASAAPAGDRTVTTTARLGVGAVNVAASAAGSSTVRATDRVGVLAVTVATSGASAGERTVTAADHEGVAAVSVAASWAGSAASGRASATMTRSPSTMPPSRAASAVPNEYWAKAVPVLTS